MTKWLLAGPVALAIACTPLAAGPEKQGVDRLAWLEGNWTSVEGDRWTEERWSDVKGGSMIGTGRSGRGETLRSFEYLRIVTMPDGSVAYIAAPGGGEATRFVLAQSTDRSVTFENTEHDFPQRISYMRNGDTLDVQISLADGTNAIDWQMQLED